LTNGSLARRALLNVPSPNPERNSYTRFIPREELGDFASWNPDSFSAPRPKAATASAPPPPPPPAAPTEDEWLAQIEAARQSAYQDGYRDGMAALEGFKKSHADQVNAQVTRFVQNLDAEFDNLHEQVAQAVTRVAVQLARQVLRSEMHTAPEVIAVVAGDAVEAVMLSARHITVQVHPQDLPLVAAGAQDVLQARGARVVAHAAVARGGCRVESDAGAIDASIAMRWTQAVNALGSEEPWDEAEAASSDETENIDEGSDR
jgi:flagellar assembly protein FliH